MSRLFALARRSGAPWIFAGLLFFAVAASALDAQGQLENPVLQSRFEQITKQLRCLVCQNESVADSDAELAAELRDEVRQMLVDGKSDKAIFEFMRARYGEFVLYDPPVDAKTVFIWGAPFVLLLIGATVIVRVVRARSRLPLDDGPTSGNPG